MDRKILVLAIALLLSLGMVTAAKPSETNPLAALQLRLDALQAQVDGLQAQVGAMHPWWDANENGLCDAEEDLNDDGLCTQEDWHYWVESFFDVYVVPLQERVDYLELQVGSLESRLADVESCTGCGGAPTLGCCAGAACTDGLTWYECSMQYSIWHPQDACADVPACNGITPDVCDSVDNDDDPQTPDGSGDPQMGMPCDGPDSDLCNEGTFTACVDGELVCSDNTASTPEVCDGADNDCNGLIDEGDVCGGTGGCSEADLAQFETCMGYELNPLTCVSELEPECGSLVQGLMMCALSQGCVEFDGGLDQYATFLCTAENCPAEYDAVFGPTPEGYPCDDGNACTLLTTWQSGVCAGGEPMACDDGIACSMDACDPDAGCVFDMANCDLTDNDGDGSSAYLDCDDYDETVFPGNSELCDYKDNDCDGEVDEDFQGGGDNVLMGALFPGDEGLSLGDNCGVNECAEGMVVCSADMMSLECSTDWMASSEDVCGDSLDNDCDGLIDEGCMDADGDGYLEGVDCDDNDPANYPGNMETCDGKDNDCDGVADYPGEMVDADGDGSLACMDCDDYDPARSPDNPEVCDGKDNDCDGFADDILYDQRPDCALQVGVCEGVKQTCDGVSGWRSCSASDYSIYATAQGKVYELIETLCDGSDNDCNGLVDEGCFLLDLGMPCASGAECMSGYCADNVCCDMACDTTCEACDINPGTCTLLSGWSDPDQCTCDDGMCIAFCGDDVCDLGENAASCPDDCV